jgi:hypothetical protein
MLEEHCPGYRERQGRSDTPEKFDALFGTGGWSRHTAQNAQRLDRDGLLRRVLSSSYAPAPQTPLRDALSTALGAAFDQHATKGLVTIGYTTVVIGGVIARSA